MASGPRDAPGGAVVQRDGGAVHDHVIAGHDVHRVLLVEEVDLAEIGPVAEPVGHGPARRFVHVGNGQRVVGVLDQVESGFAADVARAAEAENLHGVPLCGGVPFDFADGFVQDVQRPVHSPLW